MNFGEIYMIASPDAVTFGFDVAFEGFLYGVQTPLASGPSGLNHIPVPWLSGLKPARNWKEIRKFNSI